LRQLPATGTKTVILAEPTSARLIRSWKYFDADKVQTIPRWDDSIALKGDAVVRVPVKVVDGGDPGEVTVAFIPQKKDMSGLHSAIGITYRPSTTSIGSRPVLSQTAVSSPPTSPRPRKSYTNLPRLFSSTTRSPTGDLSPASPTSPGLFPLRSVRSASSIPLSVSSNLTATTTITTPDQSIPSGTQPALSLLFSPHGISYPSLDSYVQSHLASESALPLTALLHCFDSITNPWWLGGQILLGAPAGTETAGRLGARVWISAHDGDKEVKGFANGLLKTRKWAVEEVVRELRGGETGTGAVMEGGGTGTEVIALGIGEEVVLSRVGVCRTGKGEMEDWKGEKGVERVCGSHTEVVWGPGRGVPLVTEASIVVTPP
jgi:hypothetical protein